MRFWVNTFSFLLGTYVRVELPTPVVTLSNLLKNCWTILQSSCTILHCHQQRMRILIPPHLCQFLLLCLSDDKHPRGCEALCHCGFATVLFDAPLLGYWSLYSTHLEFCFSLYTSYQFIKIQLKCYSFLGPGVTIISKLNSNNAEHGFNFHFLQLQAFWPTVSSLSNQTRPLAP